MLLNFYSYKLVRDYGFAPNPFGGICTLATCKPHLRKKAKINDWIIGTGAVTTGLEHQLIYLMQVTNKITFEEYWQNNLYTFKKVVLNGSLIQMHGDNIYFKKNGIWFQTESQHSYYDSINQANLENDLSGEYVLTSNYFFYFGSQHFKVPEEFLNICCTSRDYTKSENSNVGKKFVEWVANKYSIGVHGDPTDWEQYKQLSFW